MKQRIQKKHKHIQNKKRKANLVYHIAKPIRYSQVETPRGTAYVVNFDDLCPIQTFTYSSRPLGKGCLSFNYKKAPRVFDYRSLY